MKGIKIKKPKGLPTAKAGSARLIKPAKMKAIAVPRGIGRAGGRMAAEPSLTGAAGGGRGRRRKPGFLG